MFSALFSFLGGSLFRTLLGEFSAFINKRQDHEHEVVMLRLQAELDDKAHQRSLENIRLQAEMNVRQIVAQSDGEVSKSEADAFTVAMEGAFKPTGIAVVDIWNGVIRPMAATIVLALWVAKLIGQGFTMMDWDMEISAVVLGFFFADRSLGKRGK